jgi:hypothetical protein
MLKVIKPHMELLSPPALTLLPSIFPSQPPPIFASAIMATDVASTPPVADEKTLSGHQENLKVIDDVTQIAGHGHLATDQYGRALFEVDEKAESRLR